MSEIVEYFGGPYDGRIEAIPEAVETIEVAVGPSGVPTDVNPLSIGYYLTVRYRRTKKVRRGAVLYQVDP